MTIALEKQSCSLEDRFHKALDVLQGEIFHLEEQHKKALQEIQDLHVIEVQKEKENLQLLQKANEKLNSDKQQVKISQIYADLQEHKEISKILFTLGFCPE